MSLSVFLTLLLKEEKFNGNKASPQVTNRWFTGYFVTFTTSAFLDIQYVENLEGQWFRE